MAKVTTRVTMNGNVVRQILRGEILGLADDLNRRSRNVARAAGAGYKQEGHQGANRYRTTVRQTRRDPDARATLTHALDAARSE